MSKKLLQGMSRVRVKRVIKWSIALASRVQPPRFSTSPDAVTVLMYHRVNAYRKHELSVHPEVFREQLKWLADSGFKNMKMSELESLSRGGSIGGRRVVFTFDDGYEDNCTEALPILQEFGYSAMFYISTDYIGSDRLFSCDIEESCPRELSKTLRWDQVKQMLDAGMEIGSHTMNHHLLTEIPDSEADQEIGRAKSEIEERLGTTITSFSYPGGRFNEKHLRMVREAGYASACTTEQEVWKGHDLLQIPRIPVLASDDFFVFRQKLTGHMGWFRFIH